MNDLHQYLYGACEVGGYSFISSFGEGKCTNPKNCADLGAMCHQIWNTDGDIAACVRANSFIPVSRSTAAINMLPNSEQFYQHCCGTHNSSCLGNIQNYSCRWDPDQKMGVHVGPDEKGVCNDKDSNENNAACHASNQTEETCLSHKDKDGNTLCVWNPATKTVLKKVKTADCKFALSPQVWQASQDIYRAAAWAVSRQTPED